MEQVSSSSEKADSIDGEIKPFANSANPMIRQLSLTGECNDPITVTFEDISAAAYRIKSGIRKTACEVCVLCGRHNLYLCYHYRFRCISASQDIFKAGRGLRWGHVIIF